jgi:hypothetical protein
MKMGNQVVLSGPVLRSGVLSPVATGEKVAIQTSGKDEYGRYVTLVVTGGDLSEPQKTGRLYDGDTVVIGDQAYVLDNLRRTDPDPDRRISATTRVGLRPARKLNVAEEVEVNGVRVKLVDTTMRFADILIARISVDGVETSYENGDTLDLGGEIYKVWGIWLPHEVELKACVTLVKVGPLQPAS